MELAGVGSVEVAWPVFVGFDDNFGLAAAAERADHLESEVDVSGAEFPFGSDAEFPAGFAVFCEVVDDDDGGVLAA